MFFNNLLVNECVSNETEDFKRLESKMVQRIHKCCDFEDSRSSYALRPCFATKLKEVFFFLFSSRIRLYKPVPTPISFSDDPRLFYQWLYSSVPLSVIDPLYMCMHNLYSDLTIKTSCNLENEKYNLVKSCIIFNNIKY